MKHPQALQQLKNTFKGDPALHTQTLADQIANYAKASAAYVKQVQQEIDEHTTMLKEIQQVENELLQLERMGDPKAIGFNLPGVSNITTLAAIYQQSQRDVADIAAFANPQSLKVTWQQIQSLYGQPAWGGFTSAGGLRVGAATSLINFYAKRLQCSLHDAKHDRGTESEKAGAHATARSGDQTVAGRKRSIGGAEADGGHQCS